MIDTDSMLAAVEFSGRYIHDKKNPDKSIDLLDAACARERVKDLGTLTITRDLIMAQVSRVTGVPLDRLQNERSTKILELESNIKQKLYGQDGAVDAVLERVYINFSGIGNEKRPMASFLFLGPTGTGKTELAKLLSESLAMPLLKYDMSEYQERHTVSSLIGAPPGYVGFEDGNIGGGKLISDISKNPFAVILFDEIEKAHPEVSNILLQMLDEGVLTSSNGKRVDVKNCIIIMTSNLGARDNENNNIGFSIDLERTGSEDKAVKEFFKPELRNRIDKICKFVKLDSLAIKKIVIKFVDELKVSLTGKNIRLSMSEAVVEKKPVVMSTSKADEFFKNFPKDKVVAYKDYWETVRPKNNDDIFRRYLFSFMSVHTTWKSNVNGYNAIKNFSDWMDNKEALREKIKNSGCGLYNNRTKFRLI
jgi:ATP-dependent Clp protease ATP-binding subunit ClpA